MTQYDYIFAGAGVAALATARELARRRDGLSFAFVDPDAETDEDHRTFGYWYDGAPFLPEGVGRTWDRFVVEAPFATVDVDLGEWRYDTFDIQAWRDALVAELDECSASTWIAGRVVEVNDDDNGVSIVTDGDERVTGRWLFDSRPPEPPDGARPLLWQSFRGWHVTTERPTFDPDDLFLMDFRQRDDAVQFAYVVPSSSDAAFVESVVLSAQPVSSEEEFALDGLMRDWTNFGYEVRRREGGHTALTTTPFPRRSGRRVVNIGLRGGAARPSTGYAFARIHREAVQIATGFEADGAPGRRDAPRRRDRFLDGVLLTLLTHFPERAPEVFVTLFASVKSERVLRLLDERATWTDILAVVWVLPWILFLRAWWIWLRAR